MTLFCNSCGDIMRTEQVEEAGDPNVMSTQQAYNILCYTMI